MIKTLHRPERAARTSPQATSRTVVIAPTYNHAFALIDVLERIEAVGLPIIVVNDGSTDDTAARLDAWTARPRKVPVELLGHARNRGKAHALRTGFAAARLAGYTHAATIDTDGQLRPEDLPRLLAVSQQFPDTLVLGVRRDDLTGCPTSNRLGWWITALGIWLETGRRVLDNQCGLRIYPLRLFDVVRSRAWRFSLESEMVTRAAWTGAPIREVPVECHYPPGDQRVSHFKLHRDAVAQFLFHAWLTIRRLIPWPHHRMTSGETRPAHAPGPPTWSEWISPAALWRRLRYDRFEQLLIAAAAGIGSFMSAMPLNGWQIILAVYASRRLHIHLIPALLGSLLCLTPVGAFQRDAAIWLGHLTCRWSPPDPAWLTAAHTDPWSTFLQMPFAWTFGAIIVGFFSNWITVPLLVHLFKLIPVRHDAVPGGSAGDKPCT